MKTLHTAFFVIAISPFTTFGQGNFQNLDFERATIVSDPSSPYYPSAVFANQAVPGWTAYLGSDQTSLIFYNNMALGNASIDILGPSYQNGNGSYGLALQSGNYKGQLVSASISQTGLIPAGTQSLLFDSSTYTPVKVYIGNQLVPITAVGLGPNDTSIFGVNISVWAGQTEQLTFSSTSSDSWLDNISFSSQPLSVPEPEAYALCLFGIAGFFGYRRWFKGTA